jgi:alkylated DNA repair dioxygenase AlkB
MQNSLQEKIKQKENIKNIAKNSIEKKMVSFTKTFAEESLELDLNSSIDDIGNYLKLKDKIEEASGETYNSCLLNLYHNGEEGMGWHTDNEKELKKEGAIASISFGAPRKFCFKHKQTEEKVDLLLDHGSLLVMKGSTQSHWLHRLPPSKKINSLRINLTFRTIIG